MTKGRKSKRGTEGKPRFGGSSAQSYELLSEKLDELGRRVRELESIEGLGGENAETVGKAVEMPAAPRVEAVWPVVSSDMFIQRVLESALPKSRKRGR